MKLHCLWRKERQPPKPFDRVVIVPKARDLERDFAFVLRIKSVRWYRGRRSEPLTRYAQSGRLMRWQVVHLDCQTTPGYSTDPRFVRTLWETLGRGVRK